jgi:uncharacterized protein VirK/YbjX
VRLSAAAAEIYRRLVFNEKIKREGERKLQFLKQEHERVLHLNLSFSLKFNLAHFHFILSHKSTIPHHVIHVITHYNTLYHLSSLSVRQ